MDMWEPYIRVSTQYVADRVQVPRCRRGRRDRVRRADADDRGLMADNPENMDEERWERFAELRTTPCRPPVRPMTLVAAARREGILGDPLPAGAG